MTILLKIKVEYIKICFMAYSKICILIFDGVFFLAQWLILVCVYKTKYLDCQYNLEVKSQRR